MTGQRETSSDSDGGGPNSGSRSSLGRGTVEHQHIVLIKRICDDFESQLIGGVSCDIETTLESARTDSSHPEFLRELLGELIALKLAHAQQPETEAAKIKSLFPGQKTRIDQLLKEFLSSHQDVATPENAGTTKVDDPTVLPALSVPDSSKKNADVRVGDTLGDYELVAKIGVGGMGQVFKARHRRMKRMVALKTLPDELSGSQELVQRFEREVEAAAKLDHPNIVTAYDAGEDSGIHFLVMKFIEGLDIATLISQQGALTPSQAVDLTLQAAKGLAYAHSRGIVHRDIKPANLLLDKSGTLQILDMGVARIEDSAKENLRPELTQAGAVMGTVDYLPPEQAIDSRKADNRSDIYSLGCSFYQMLTGAKVFQGDTMMQIILAHCDAPLPVLTKKVIGLPAEFDQVLEKMLAKKPADRFQNMDECISALERLHPLSKDLEIEILAEELPAEKAEVEGPVEERSGEEVSVVSDSPAVSATAEQGPSLNPLLLDWLLTCDLRRIRDIDELFQAIAIRIAEIDQMLVFALRQVLGSKKFQQLESSFLSIYKLVSTGSSGDLSIRNLPESRRVNVFVLDVSAEELESDLNANSHRQTWIYDKLFRKRFDYLVGEQTIELENYSAIYPFSLMIVDFDFSLNASERSVDRQIDLETLRKLAKIGEECFCMFLVNLSPNFFGDSIQRFEQLENVIDVRAILRQSKYDRWNEFRQQESSRMIGLTMPRVLVREPYRNYLMGDSANSNDDVATGIVFHEHEGFVPSEKLLWGRSCFAVAQPIIRSFRLYDWFSEVSGVDRDPKELAVEGEEPEASYDGGLIGQLPKTCFDTDAPGVACYPPTEIVISETDESIYSSLGLIPLFSVHQSYYVSLLSCQSVQRFRAMNTDDATANLRLSSMFNYMLCVCRMAHRLKMECRSQIGKSVGAETVQDHMQEWLMQHSSGQNRGFEQKMVKPFFDEATGFFVYEDVTDPGRYDCTIRLCPHHKYDSGKTRVVFEPVTLQMQLNANEEGG